MSHDIARILVVEDNRDTSALLRDLLEAEGYGVESALTGEKALEVLAQNPDVDLLVLDLMLPGMSGYDVIEKLRADGDLASIPVLVLSALSSASARSRGLRDGADDYMTKPFLPEELLARTRTLVTSRLLERRTRELQALGQIAQASLTAMSADVLLQRTVEITAEVFGADFALLFLADEARHELRALGVRSLMVAPLIVGGSAVGVLEVGRRTRRLDPRADRLLRIVADRVAVAIELARLEGEARELADVVRRISEGVVVAEADDRVTFANAAFAEMVGVAPEGLLGRSWTEFLTGAQDTAALTERMRQPTFQGEVLLITRSGEPRPTLVSFSTVPREGGRLERIGVFRDISREHELRFRVIREQKFRTLGSLAAGVAHNINNRLTPVLGWTEMLLERLAAGETLDHGELVHALTVITQGASDSVGTVRRLQEYARPGRARGPEAVQLRDVIGHLLALTRPSGTTKPPGAASATRSTSRSSPRPRSSRWRARSARRSSTRDPDRPLDRLGRRDRFRPDAERRRRDPEAGNESRPCASAALGLASRGGRQEEAGNRHEAAGDGIGGEPEPLEGVGPEERGTSRFGKDDESHFRDPVDPDPRPRDVALDTPAVGQGERCPRVWVHVQCFEHGTWNARVRGARIHDRVDPRETISRRAADLDLDPKRPHAPSERTDAAVVNVSFR